MKPHFKVVFEAEDLTQRAFGALTLVCVRVKTLAPKPRHSKVFESHRRKAHVFVCIRRSSSAVRPRSQVCEQIRRLNPTRSGAANPLQQCCASRQGIVAARCRVVDGVWDAIADMGECLVSLTALSDERQGLEPGYTGAAFNRGAAARITRLSNWKRGNPTLDYSIE
jgi:hypothetical protein